eukprot:362425-Chlamydomonas_euryale.AAC.6
MGELDPRVQICACVRIPTCMHTTWARNVRVHGWWPHHSSCPRSMHDELRTGDPKRVHLPAAGTNAVDTFRTILFLESPLSHFHPCAQAQQRTIALVASFVRPTLRSLSAIASGDACSPSSTTLVP